jgi:hypothetical protein
MDDSILNEKGMGLKKSILSTKEQVNFFFVPVRKFTTSSKIKREFDGNGGIIDIETPYGKVQIRNRLLNETHQRILNEIINVGEIIENQDGSVTIYFRDLDILENLNMGKNNQSHLRDQIKEIVDIVYYVGNRRPRAIRIAMTHKLDDTNVQQSIVLSKEYIEMKKIEIAIASSSINKSIQKITLSTVPTIIRQIYIEAMGIGGIQVNLPYLLNKINFHKSPKTFNRLTNDLLSFKAKFREEFFINYNEETQVFTTLDEIEKNLSFIRSIPEDEGIFDQYLGISFESEDGLKHTISKIVKKGLTEYNIITEENEVIYIKEFLDDFLYYLDELKEHKNTKPRKDRIIKIKESNGGQGTLF